jgi:cytochrome c oxidase cbb3-type subunit 4
MATFHSIFTVFLFVLFIGIVVWAYSKKRKQDFDEAARLPFVDEEQKQTDNNGGRS